jgi:predicted MFS family arabinose efflux permease
MLTKAYEAQCRATKLPSPPPAQERRRGFALFALALGSFVIGTSEFASMGILQIFSADLHITVPVATHAITGYALGVLLGAPIVTLAAAHLNRRTLLLGLMSLFIIANLLSAVATGIGMLAVARFISGLPQGAYFGAGAVVAAYFFGPSQGGRAFALVMTGLTVATIFGAPIATFVGQHLGWRDTYTLVAGLGVLALAALWMWVPQTDELRGSSIGHELSALRKRNVWAMMTVAALSVASIFAVYTFIGPFITDVAQLSIGIVPISLALFGLGMTAGNLIGGRLHLSGARRRIWNRTHRTGDPGSLRICSMDPAELPVRRRRHHDDRHSNHSGTVDTFRPGGTDLDGRDESRLTQSRKRSGCVEWRSRDRRRLWIAFCRLGRIRPDTRRSSGLCGDSTAGTSTGYRGTSLRGFP